LKARVPRAVAIRSLGASFSLADVVSAMREQGWRTIVCEGGPTILGELLALRLVDELFLTVSPVLVGRNAGTLALVEGVELHDGPVRFTLSSLRIDRGGQMFTRCLVGTAATEEK
ncbi:MAG: dihydrofolate reductase family protein, partial [Polyangiaceae bacterium]